MLRGAKFEANRSFGGAESRLNVWTACGIPNAPEPEASFKLPSGAANARDRFSPTRGYLQMADKPAKISRG